MIDQTLSANFSMEEDAAIVVPYAPTEPQRLDIDPVMEEVEKMEFYCVLFLIMTFFFVIAACNERFKFKCGHQTSFTIILGVVVALILWLAFGEKRTEIYKFKQDFFFDFLLPPIILNSGFNMRRKKFF